MVNAREFLSAVIAGDLTDIQRLSEKGLIGGDYEKHASTSDNIG